MIAKDSCRDGVICVTILGNKFGENDERELMKGKRVSRVSESSGIDQRGEKLANEK